MATLSVILPGESPWTEEPGGLQSMDCKELDMTERLSTGSLACCSSWGCRVRQDLATGQQQECYNFAFRV